MTGSQSLALDDDDDLPEAVRKAQEAVAALAENFTEWMRADLDAALASLAKAKDSQPDNASHLADIYSVCHNIKGQGGSFGYDLITHVGKSVCDYIHETGPASERKLKVVEARRPRRAARRLCPGSRAVRSPRGSDAAAPTEAA